MNVRQFWEKCKSNWTVKIFCFVLAVFIYFFYRNITLTTRTMIVPLGISAHGNMVPAGYHPPQVKVTLRGEPSEISQITDNDISAVLNIDYYAQAGKYEIPVQLMLSPSVAVMEPLEVNVTPAVVPLEIAQRVHVQIPVEVDIQGEPMDGFSITHTQVLPSTVRVTGAEPVVGSIGHFTTDSVSVDGKNASFSQEVKIHTQNKLITIDDVSEVTVAVVIEPVQATKEFMNQSVYLYGLNPLFIARLEPSDVTFVLSGSQLAMNRYVPELYTVRADCSGITQPGEYDIPVTITVPSGLRIVSQSSRNVKVVIAAVEQEEENPSDGTSNEDASVSGQGL